MNMLHQFTADHAFLFPDIAINCAVFMQTLDDEMFSDGKRLLLSAS